MKECVPKGDGDDRKGRFCRYSTHILPIRDSLYSEKSIIYHQMNGGIEMNQLVIGKYISLKRKQKNMTQ